MITGEKKKTYQRNYMRIRRAREKLYKPKSNFVRPKVVRPLDADGNMIYDE